MPSMAETIARLRSGLPMGDAVPSRLSPLTGFGSNPGALLGYCHVPASLLPKPALVVVLHGCTQNAAGYDHGSGWSDLADRHGFALLFPEQQRANNANVCFNWFESQNIRRDAGEALSIRQMVAAMCERHAIDPARIYVTGLSAGGAMANVMLATYPDVFAGGAIIAGLPFGIAQGVPQALEAMRGQGQAGPAKLGALVRAASPHLGPWPAVSVWHGASDRTVVPANAAAILDQWRDVHRLPAVPARSGLVAGHRHRVWTDRDGRDVLEEYHISGLGHGTPLAVTGDDACGAVGPHMLEAGISSSVHIARRWGLLRAEAASTPPRPAASTPPRPAASAASAPTPAAPTAAPTAAQARAEAVGKSVADVIERALRSAGLMR
ncbi:extracellular catalytic domain type 1 short-chain-length polyhydroxyalkanoate depolymerase [Sphingomonas sp. 37zxx]|uniref:extracellular catalytic domain type 1 short-chain-length polyhydroxyalkanoate depolymerase n=1 Tax=Sphingomonas sp. 37zxx TaxID=1550073 RepID=UPI00053BE1FE|nr:PHB depolymerase family esterase [Sphingomonas sp. 37zxx]